MPGGSSRTVGRYELFDRIASGGMASVHLGRLIGPAGFKRTVAIKRMHEHLALDPAFVAMFTEEARLAARVTHPNVVATFDVVVDAGELFLVMDHVRGETLSRLIRAAAEAKEPIPVPIAVSIVVGMLAGLHAAHEAKDEGGAPLGLIHRDVSPQNVIVGADGVARLLDFGIAKATSTVESTRDDHVKGKAAYMAPEQLRREKIDRRTDVYAAGAVLWEALTSRRLFEGDAAAVVAAVLHSTAPAPSTLAPHVPPELDAIVLRALATDPATRYATAHEMADALETLAQHASSRRIGEWVERLAAETLTRQSAALAALATPRPTQGAAADDLSELATDVPSPGRDSPGGSATNESKTNEPLTSPTAPSAPQRRTAWWVVGSLLAVALVTLGLLQRPKPAAVAAGGPTSSTTMGSASGTASASTSTSPPTEERAPAPSAEAPRAATPSATSPSAPSPPSPSTRPTAKATARGDVHPPPPKPTPRPNCNPNYTVDADGIKHFKPECI